MRIGIDYTAAVRQGAGIGRYTRNLVRALADLDRENTFKLFVAGGWGNGDGFGPWPANFGIRSVPISDRWLNILWQRLKLPVPVQIVTGSLDLFHSPDFVLPPTGRVPAIVTVHDLSFLRVPQYFVPSFRAYLEGAVSAAVERARHILVDSESTRADLVELLSVDPGRITVLYPGVESRFCPVLDARALRAVRERYSLPARFVLGLGTLQPRKNFDGLIEAFWRLLQDQSDALDLNDLHLVIVGGKGWMYEDLLAQSQRYGLGERIHFTGFADDADLPALYTLATVFALPSWYEGFGIPVVEAMACGTPVVTANNSSLVEAAGNAALLVEAGDCDSLADALGRLVTDEELRSRLVIAGREHVQRFDWHKSARELAAAYASFA